MDPSLIDIHTPELSQMDTENDKFAPAAPRTIEDTGLSVGFLADLVLKVLYFEGYISGYEVADAVRLPFKNITDRILEFLKRDRFIEVKGSSGVPGRFWTGANMPARRRLHWIAIRPPYASRLFRTWRLAPDK
jgi:hypothetical protein